MTSFYSIELYNPLYVLLIGLLTFFGFIGFGLVLMKLFCITIENPWRQVAAALLGLLCTSIVVQAVAMVYIATIPVLTGIWAITMPAGFIIFIREEVRRKKINLPAPRGWALLPFILLLAALITNLLAAMAPSSKIDELYTYMTLPSRIVNDGGMKFYLMPWEGAILPQMLFQISLTPLHALGYPDAGNVVSWGLIAMLAWFGWRLAIAKNEITGWGYLALACLVTGMYPAIWNVTGGSYSMGDLSTAASVVALLSHKEMIAKNGINKYALLTSFLVLGSVSSRVTLLPLGIAVLLLMFFFICRNNAFAKNSLRIVAFYTLVPWMILYLPILIWTFLQSGSPFGPLFAGLFHNHSVYDPEKIRNIQQIGRQVNIPSLYTIFENTLIYFPGFLWFGVLFFLVGNRVPASIRLTALIILILQTSILLFIIFFDPRFYGGLLQGILIMWVIYQERSGWKQFVFLKCRVIIGAIIFLIPWLALQIFYASQFFPVATGLQDKMEFYQQKIAFTKDYLALNKILPRDAVLVIRGENEVRLNINYAPRPVFLSQDHPPSEKKIYLFCINQSKPLETKEYQINSLVYTNDKAIITTYRNPYRSPIIGKLDVYSTDPITHPVKIE